MGSPNRTSPNEYSLQSQVVLIIQINVVQQKHHNKMPRKDKNPLFSLNT